MFIRNSDMYFFILVIFTMEDLLEVLALVYS